MFTKTLIATAAVAATLAVAAPAQQAQAKTNIDISVGFGLGGYGPGYGYGGGYGGGYVDYEPVYSGISCGKGAKIVKWSGFHNVSAIDCSAPVYKYHARKGGNWYRVRVNTYGNIIGVKHL